MKNIILIFIFYCVSILGCANGEYLERGTNASDAQRSELIYAWNPYTEKTPLDLLNRVGADIIYKEDPRDTWQSPKYTFQIKTGDCEDKALLLLACLLHEGYDACLVIGTTDSSESIINHAWVCLTLGGQEFYLDPTYQTVPFGLIPKTDNQFNTWKEAYRVKKKQQNNS